MSNTILFIALVLFWLSAAFALGYMIYTVWGFALVYRAKQKQKKLNAARMGKVSDGWLRRHEQVEREHWQEQEGQRKHIDFRV